MKNLNFLYKSPIITDLVISLLVYTTIQTIEISFGELKVYSKYDISICSDLGSIGFTISGFLITAVTILISFKTSALSDEKKLTNESNSFLIFISSSLYFQTVQFINKSVVILVILSVANYLLKVFSTPDFKFFIFRFNLITITLILTSFLRSVYVLGLIIKMQKG